MNLAGRLAALAGTQPERPAIIDRRGRTLTFGALDASAAALAGHLTRQGAQPGQRALLLTPLSPALYVTLAALWRAGLVPVVVDPGAGLRHLRAALQRVPPDVLIGVPAAAPLLLIPEVRRIRRQVWLWNPSRWTAGPPGAPTASPMPLPGEHPALITFTSGSTGLPKAAVRTHAFLNEQRHVLARHLAYEPGGLDLATLAVVALVSLASGRTVLLPDSALRRPARLNTRRVLRQLRAHPADTVAASPALLHTLAQAALDAGQPLPFRRVFTGGGPVFPRTLHLLARAAPHADLISVYGSTEVEPIAHQRWADVTPTDLDVTRAGGGLLAGPPIEELDVLLLPETTGTLTYPSEAALRAAAGRTGELLVSGPHVLPGYLDGLGDTETKWRDPQTGQVWHRTGDAARLDDHGRLWLLGRAGKHVQDDQGTLYPFAVEAAAMTHPAVTRAALLPGRRVLCVQWAGAPDPTLAGTLAWAHLTEIRTVPTIPLDRRHNAKVDYPALARQHPT